MRDRLQRAALELFQENGYDRTTAAGIAARAGVTERTFFRYFPDKREVLFDGEAGLRIALVDAIAKASEGLGAIDVLFAAFRTVVPLLEGNRPYAKPRHDLISSTPALAEREAAKVAALTEALADALRIRGVADLPAALAARTGMTAFAYAVVKWLDAPPSPLQPGLDATFEELRKMLS